MKSDTEIRKDLQRYMTINSLPQPLLPEHRYLLPLLTKVYIDEDGNERYATNWFGVGFYYAYTNTEFVTELGSVVGGPHDWIVRQYMGRVWKVRHASEHPIEFPDRDTDAHDISPSRTLPQSDHRS